MSKLSPQVGQEMLGGATFRDSGEKVVRNVGDLETIQVELPTVTQATEGPTMMRTLSMYVTSLTCSSPNRVVTGFRSC